MPKRNEGRRANNQGTVFQDKNGVWWAQLPADERGRRPRRRAKTEDEAYKKLHKMQQDRERGLDLTTKTPTIEAYAATWLETVVKRHRKPSTADSYKYVINHYILPHLGSFRINQLSIKRVRQFVNDMMDEGYSADTVRSVYMRLRGLLQAAVDEGLTAYNLNAKIDLPKPKMDVARILTLSEAQTLLDILEGHRLAALYHIFLGLGLRRGEGLGLQWSDLDWDKETITVRQQVQIIDGKIAKSTPKNDKIRTLPLPTALVERLRGHWQNQIEERKLLKVQWKEHGLIFASETGTPINPSNLHRHFKATLQAARLSDMRLHDLRHTCATMLGDLEVEERIIAALLGHTAKNLTRRYARATLNAMRTAVERLYVDLLKRAA